MDGLREERDQRWTRREEERGIARTEQHRTRTRHSLSRRRGRGAAAQTLPSWSVLWHCRSTAPATGSLALQSHECMHGYVDSKLQRARSSDFKASNTNSNPAISAHKTPIVINRLSIARCASTRKPGSRLLSITSCTIACASCSRSTTLFLAKMPSYLIGRYALNDHTLLLAVVLLS